MCARADKGYYTPHLTAGEKRNMNSEACLLLLMMAHSRERNASARENKGGPRDRPERWQLSDLHQWHQSSSLKLYPKETPTDVHKLDKSMRSRARICVVISFQE